MPRKRRPEAMQGEDGLWHVWVTIGTRPNGKPHQRHIKRKSKDTAEDAADELLSQLKATGQVAKSGAKPTVESWMNTYLTTVAPQRCVESTLYDYASKMRSWVYPRFGAKRLDKFDVEDWDAINLAMMRAGKAQSHRLKVYRILSRALDIAHRRGLVIRNVMKLVDPPSVDQVVVRALSEDVALKVIKAAEGRHNPERWTIGFALGLRQGEALGLRWQDDEGTPLVDLDARIMRVWWQLRRDIYRHGCAGTCGGKRGADCPMRSGGGLVYRKCKGKSRRALPIPPELVDPLRALRKRQDEVREMLGGKWSAGDAVFATADGRLVDPRRDYDEWTAILAEAGIRHVKPHIMRHTAATLLLAQGVGVRVVQELLGHQDVQTTQIYTQDVDVLLKDAMKLTLLRPKKDKSKDKSKNKNKKPKIKGVRKGVLHGAE